VKTFPSLDWWKNGKKSELIGRSNLAVRILVSAQIDESTFTAPKISLV
jgi:hypothetical protein